MLPTDEEARNAILEALYEEKRSGSLSFEQLHDKLNIPWPILWVNLDYLEEENLIVHQKQENSTGGGSLSSTYVISEKGEMVMEHKDDYAEEYPFLTMCTDEFDEFS